MKSAPLGGALGVLLLALVIAFAWQGSRHLWDPDEGRYTDVAHHMVESGDWLVPRLDPGRAHFTKPPLTYWVLGASFKAFGKNEWAARLPNALAFVATALLVLGLARRLGLPAPAFAAAIWTTALGPVAAANVVTTDTLLAAFETLAVYGFLSSGLQAGVALHKRGLRLMWLGFGLAFLTKGPPGLLPLASIVAFVAWRRRESLARLFDPPGLLLFAVVGLGWYLLLIWRTPELLQYFLAHEVVGRIATGEHHRNAGWFGWLAVYGPTLLVGSMPWAAFAAWAWRRRRLAGLVATPAETEVRRFLWLWILLPLTVFVLARSRLPLYVLPLFVPLALLLSVSLQAWTSAGRRVLPAIAAASALALAVKLAGVFVHTDDDAFELAAELRAAGDTAGLEEIVFVDHTPRYGLKHYLGIDVTEARSGMASSGRSGYAAPAQLCELLRQPRRRWLLVPASGTAEFTASLGTCGLRAQALGELRQWEIYLPLPAQPD